jgi:hypothetical protein
MIKIVMMLLVGAAAGYFYGFADAQHNKEHIAARAVIKVGDWRREQLTNDVDKQMERMER